MTHRDVYMLRDGIYRFWDDIQWESKFAERAWTEWLNQARKSQLERAFIDDRTAGY